MSKTNRTHRWGTIVGAVDGSPDDREVEETGAHSLNRVPGGSGAPEHRYESHR